MQSPKLQPNVKSPVGDILSIRKSASNLFEDCLTWFRAGLSWSTCAVFVNTYRNISDANLTIAVVSAYSFKFDLKSRNMNFFFLSLEKKIIPFCQQITNLKTLGGIDAKLTKFPVLSLTTGQSPRQRYLSILVNNVDI